MIVIAIVSIAVGVIGYSSIFGINLDSISMMLFTMSVGFSVDYCAHVVHGFVKAKGTSNERALESVETMSVAVTQGALSTVLGSLILVLVPTHLVKSFYTILFCVVLLGLLHACVFLPVILSSEDYIRGRLFSNCKSKKKVYANEHNLKA